MTTIAYDEPVLDLIAGLDATGHITHGNYHKTMVTLHHNGGGPNFTPQTILDIWKTRAASAHFDVDGHGAVAQFADVHDYAWACANTYGNETSISIEMANSALAPTWAVSETTWKSAARLTGWLFAHVIGTRPTSATLVYHHHWYATACAGPYMDSVYDQVLAAAQAAYDTFKGHPTPTPVPPKPTPPAPVLWTAGPKVVTALQDHFHSPGRHDGYFDGQDARYVGNFPRNRWTSIRWVSPATGSTGVCAMQRGLGVTADGLLGPNTARALQRWAGATQDGICGTNTIQAICRKLGIH